MTDLVPGYSAHLPLIDVIPVSSAMVVRAIKRILKLPIQVYFRLQTLFSVLFGISLLLTEYMAIANMKYVHIGTSECCFY